MSHAKSLRVIGQFLDIASVPSFELEKESHAQDYLVRSDSLTKTPEWILRHARDENDFIEESARPVADDGLLRFTPIDIPGSSLKGNGTAAPIPRHKRKGQKIYLNCCGAWTITLTELRPVLFV